MSICTLSPVAAAKVLQHYLCQEGTGSEFITFVGQRISSLAPLGSQAFLIACSGQKLDVSEDLEMWLENTTVL